MSALFVLDPFKALAGLESFLLLDGGEAPLRGRVPEVAVGALRLAEVGPTVRWSPPPPAS